MLSVPGKHVCKSGKSFCWSSPIHNPQFLNKNNGGCQWNPKVDLLCSVELEQDRFAESGRKPGNKMLWSWKIVGRLWVIARHGPARGWAAVRAAETVEGGGVPVLLLFCRRQGEEQQRVTATACHEYGGDSNVLMNCEPSGGCMLSVLCLPPASPHLLALLCGSLVFDEPNGGVCCCPVVSIKRGQCHQC